MMNDNEKDVIYDYSKVDRYLEELIKREEAQSAKGAYQKAFETLLILVGLGLFALLVGLAIRLVVYQPLG